MGDEKPISDAEVGDRLAAAEKALGNAPGATKWGDTVLRIAREAIKQWKLAHIRSGVRNGD